jgi:sortase (surface protein transpeptidase)
MTRSVSRRIVLVAALAPFSVAAVAGSQGTATSDDVRTIAAVSPAPPSVVGSFRSVRSYEEVAAPVRLRIPAARVDTPLQRLGRAADATIEVPSDFGVAGWFGEGPRPGQAGPAVILGHVDSHTGPGVFYQLAGLAKGAEVDVDRADGSTATFRVTGLQRVPKAGFPTDLVYGPTLEPSLRLVTCGGSFDRATGSYLDNVIVYADPVH